MDKQLKVLEGIQPFNNFFYCTCFYSSAAPVLKKFAVPISAIFVNLQYYYVLEKNQISVEYSLNRELVDLFAQYGICMKERKGYVDLKSYIKEEIDQGCPVIVFVDLYYLSHRTDGYQKSHDAHSLLIYGYDAYRNLFQVVEHSESNTLDFAEMQVKMDDIVTAHKAYVDNIDDFGFVACSFEGSDAKNNTLTEESFFEAYCEFQKTLYPQRRAGIDLLDEYSRNFEKTVLNQSELDDKIQQLDEYFQLILKAKKGEFELLKSIKADEGKIQIAGDLLALWVQIYNPIQYYLLSRRYKNKSMERLVEIMKEICRIERDAIVS